jgi:hypothetical protein
MPAAGRLVSRVTPGFLFSEDDHHRHAQEKQNARDKPTWRQAYAKNLASITWVAASTMCYNNARIPF